MAHAAAEVPREVLPAAKRVKAQTACLLPSLHAVRAFASGDVRASPRVGAFVFHFGATRSLLDELAALAQAERREPRQEQFADTWYDTDEFDLARQNCWLRTRVHEAPPPEDSDSEDDPALRLRWSLNECGPRAFYEPGTLAFRELTDTTAVTRRVWKLLPADVVAKGRRDGRNPAESFIPALHPQVFLPTTRRTYVDSDSLRLYVDCVAIGPEYVLLGGARMRSTQDARRCCDLLQDYAIVQPVRSKLMEAHFRRKAAIYDTLLRHRFVPDLPYTDAHVFREPPLPMAKLCDGAK